MNTSENPNTIFPKGEKASADYFTGTAWVKILVAVEAGLNCVVGNVIFEPGARNNWHTHPGGQILLATDGTGYYQEKGKPAQIVHKGDVIKCLPGVAHWHAAAPNSSFAYVAISPAQKGKTIWLQ